MQVQFALPLTLSDEPSLSNFMRGSNDEAVSQCERIAQGLFDHTSLYLWGVTGAGKSHLLHSLADLPHAQWARLDDSELEANIYVVDNVELLSRVQQEYLFHLYNRVRADSKIMVLAASCPPAQLPVEFLPDLKTRFGWDLVYQLHPLTDEDKERVLIEQADQRGLILGNGVVTYMLRHLTRDLSQLHRFLQHLDEYSLQQQRALTLPLLKEWLEHDSYHFI